MKNKDRENIIVRHVIGYENFAYEVFYPSTLNGGYIVSQSINLARSGRYNIWRESNTAIEYYLHECEAVSTTEARAVAQLISEHYGIQCRIQNRL